MSGFFWVSLALAFIAVVWVIIIISDHFGRIEAEREAAKESRQEDTTPSAAIKRANERINWEAHFDRLDRALKKQRDREHSAKVFGPIRSRLTTIAKAKQRKVKP